MEHPDVEKIAGESFKRQIGERDTKILELEGRLSDMQSNIAVEVAKAFQKVKSVEDEISAQKDRIQEVGQLIFDEVYAEEMKGVSPDEQEYDTPHFGDFDRLPVSLEDFKVSYLNMDDEVEHSYFIEKSFWKEAVALPGWHKLVKEYARLSELQEKPKNCGKVQPTPRECFSLRIFESLV